MGGDQNLEQRNVARPVFRNFEIANVNTLKTPYRCGSGI